MCGNSPNVHQPMKGETKSSIHTMEGYPAIKRNEGLACATRMDLENVILSDKRPHTARCHLYETSRLGGSVETGSV